MLRVFATPIAASHALASAIAGFDALGVDSESPTGATRLYERAGMHVERHFGIYQKTLREGDEPA